MSTFNFTNNEERTNNNTTTKLICDFGGEHGDKVGFKNENGELVIPYKYGDAMQYEVENEPIVVKLNNKWGLVDCNGNALSDFKYDEIKSLKEAMKVRIGDKWGVIDEFGRELCALKYDAISGIRYNANNDTPILVKYYDRYGFINTRGEEIIPLQYDFAYNFINDWAVVRVGGLWGIINRDGDMVVEPQYEKIVLPSNMDNANSVIVVKNNKWGLIDAKGNILCDIKYDKLCQDYRFTNYFYIKLNGKTGLITDTGEVILPMIYDNIDMDFELTKLRIGDKWGYTLNFTDISEIKYDEIKADAGLVSVRVGDKWGLHHTSRHASYLKYSCDIENEGKINELFECKYDDINTHFHYVALKLNNKWSYINVSLEDGSVHVLCDHKYDYMLCTFSGFAIVMLDNKWGHINSEGKEICGLKYDDAYGFVQKMEYDIINNCQIDYLNIAGVCINGKWGFIDENGNEVCKPMFDEIKIWHGEMDGYFYEAYLGNKTYSLSKTGVFVEK